MKNLTRFNLCLCGIILLFIIPSKFIWGQEKLLYKGDFSSTHFQGTAIYQYYKDKSHQQIFDGSFSFTQFNSNNSNVNIQGQFSNNKKDGTWSFHFVNTPYCDGSSKYIITSNTTGSFYQGNLNGHWFLNRTRKIPCEQIEYRRTLDELFALFDEKRPKKDSLISETTEANFKDNHFVGAFKYSINESTIKGQFNDNGYFDGTWNIMFVANGLNYDEIRTYNNGVLLNVKLKNNLNEVTNNPEISTVSSIILKQAIAIWFNNPCPATSSYALEISSGSNPMTIFPEKEGLAKIKMQSLL